MKTMKRLNEKMHVFKECFYKTIEEAKEIEFRVINEPEIIMSRTVVL